MMNVAQYAATIERRNGNTVPGFVVTWTARARITVKIPRPDGSEKVFVREGQGTCSAINESLAEASEMAIKGAETDALKRAAVSFGPRFGLGLDDQQGPAIVLTASQQRLAGVHRLPTGTPRQPAANTTDPTRPSPQTAETAPRTAVEPPALPATRTLPPSVALLQRPRAGATLPPTATPASREPAIAPITPINQTESPGLDPWDAADTTAENPQPDYSIFSQAEWVEAFRSLTATAHTSQQALAEAIASLARMHPSVQQHPTQKVRDWFVTMRGRLADHAQHLANSPAQRDTLLAKLDALSVGDSPPQ